MSPNCSRAITAPETAAIVIGAKACSAKWRSTTSKAKSAPAMGALNEADTAAATAQPKRSLLVSPDALMRSLTHVEMSPAKCTTGPSRPLEPPVPRVMMDANTDAIPALISTRPSPKAAPSITSATDLARPSGVKKCRMSPTASPPHMGTSRIQYHGSVCAKLCKRATSSVP